MDRKTWWAVLIVVAGVGFWFGATYWFETDRVAEPVSGSEVYARNCAGCHGVKGRGQGRAAEYLYPKPRDLTSGTYKFTSTPNAELPTDTDLIRTVRDGLSPAGMPGFDQSLNDRQIKAVVDYIKGFSPRFEEEQVPRPVEVSDPPEPLLAEGRVQTGRALYEKLGCGNCHGVSGAGDGPAADSQRDQWGDPVKPADLTRGNFKSGEAPRDIYRRVVTGINGTGMPPYGSALPSEKDRWALVAYVTSLSQDTAAAPGPPSSGLVAGAVNVDTSALKNPLKPIWATSERSRLPLYSLWQPYRTSTSQVELRALHNGSVLALRMSWQDPTMNNRPAGVTEFSDAAAVMFPDMPGAVPFLGMGDTDMKGGMAHVWHWRAVDQMAVDRGGTTVDLEDAYPRMQVDYYRNRDRETREPEYISFRDTRQHTSRQPDTFQTSWAVGNPLGRPRIDRPVRSYRAEGFGSLTALDTGAMKVDGHGVYRDGRWLVTFVRPLRTRTRVVQFEPGRGRSVALAVWDGAQGDRNGQKDITSWINLELEPRGEVNEP